MALAGAAGVLLGAQTAGRRAERPRYRPFALQATEISGEIAGAYRYICGALLRDDFSAAELDAARWNIWQGDDGVRVATSGGRLVIAGRSSPAAPRRDLWPRGPAHVGAVSPTFAATDVVAVAHVSASRPVTPAMGWALYTVHLCCTVPDLYTEVSYGTAGGDTVGWDRKTVGLTAADVTATTRQWDLSAATVVIEHDAAVGVERAWLIAEGERHALGPPAPLPRSGSRLELKTLLGFPGLDVRMEVEYAALYPHPARHPLRVYVCRRMVTPVVPAPGVEVALTTAHGVSAAVSDGDGWAWLRLPADAVYPLGGTFVLRQAGVVLGEARVAAREVEGIYPGDTWGFQLRPRTDSPADGYSSQTTRKPSEAALCSAGPRSLR